MENQNLTQMIQLLQTLLQGQGLAAPKPSSTDPDLERELDEIVKGLPVTIRAPQPGTRCIYTELSRTGFLELIVPCKQNNYQPPVQAIYRKRNPKALRGVWLVPTRSLFGYLWAQRGKAAGDYLKMRAERLKAKAAKVAKTV